VKDLTKVLIIKEQTNIVKEQISLTEITNNTLSQLSITVDDNDVKVNYNYKNAPFVNFTKAYLESVFQNLFTNSIKYKSPKRKLKINITSNESPNYIILKFIDNGIGIDTELHKEKLFKLYQRFHDNPDGKGLGLYLIKSQIEALGGSIAIESKVDVGTTFIIKFKK
jgi:signal transduction histidine kinase